MANGIGARGVFPDLWLAEDSFQSLGGSGRFLSFLSRLRKAGDSPVTSLQEKVTYLTPVIASTEPEQGPNTDLLGSSPKASLGQYAGWWVDWLGEGGPQRPL